MMEILFLLWPITGWLCAYFSTPRWMLESNPFGWFLLFFFGAVAGPFGVFWFCTNDGIKGDNWKR